MSSMMATKAPKLKNNSASRLNPILISASRSQRKNKSKVSWHSELEKYHYFEYVADERINVTRLNNSDQQQQQAAQQNDIANASATSAPGSSLNKVPNAAGSDVFVDPLRRLGINSKDDSANASNTATAGATAATTGIVAAPAAAAERTVIEYFPWRSLIPLDFIAELQSPGWGSLERSAQAERESYVLGAIDLPGQASVLYEPDELGNNKSSSSSAPTAASSLSSSSSIAPQTATDPVSATNQTGPQQCTIEIPADNKDGTFTEYQNMYTQEYALPYNLQPEIFVVYHPWNFFGQ